MIQTTGRTGAKLKSRDGLKSASTKPEVDMVGPFGVDFYPVAGVDEVHIQKIDQRPTQLCPGQPLLLIYHCGCVVRIELALELETSLPRHTGLKQTNKLGDKLCRCKNYIHISAFLALDPGA